MATMSIEIQDAPSSPLNLQFGVTYAPRVATPPFVAFRAVGVHARECAIEAFDAGGAPHAVFRGALWETYRRLASHLRMDVAPPAA